MSRVPPVVILADAGLPAWVAMALEAERAAATAAGSPVVADVQDSPAASARVEQRAAEYGAAVVHLPTRRTDDLGLGLASSVALLRGAAVAAELGCSRVVWPIALGPVLAAPDAAERVGREADRALLAARLAGLDAAGPGLTMETPFVDLEDEQVAELALDLGLALDSAGVPESARWLAALRGLGWSGALLELTVASDPPTTLRA